MLSQRIHLPHVGVSSELVWVEEHPWRQLLSHKWLLFKQQITPVWLPSGFFTFSHTLSVSFLNWNMWSTLFKIENSGFPVFALWVTRQGFYLHPLIQFWLVTQHKDEQWRFSEGFLFACLIVFLQLLVNRRRSWRGCWWEAEVWGHCKYLIFVHWPQEASLYMVKTKLMILN